MSYAACLMRRTIYLCSKPQGSSAPATEGRALSAPATDSATPDTNHGARLLHGQKPFRGSGLASCCRWRSSAACTARSSVMRASHSLILVSRVPRVPGHRSTCLRPACTCRMRARCASRRAKMRPRAWAGSRLGSRIEHSSLRCAHPRYFFGLKLLYVVVPKLCKRKARRRRRRGRRGKGGGGEGGGGAGGGGGGAAGG